MLRMNSTGIGIGTTTPKSPLHVSAGAVSGTTTISIGEIGSTTSKACINMQTSAGTAASFFINAAGTMVTELNACK
jgi:hypothetical protein